MSKKLEKALKDANKELKNKGHFKNYEITVEHGRFLNLSNDHHHFPIADIETEEEAIAAINGYLTGLRHGKENSYPKFCDKE